MFSLRPRQHNQPKVPQKEDGIVNYYIFVFKINYSRSLLSCSYFSDFQGNRNNKMKKKKKHGTDVSIKKENKNRSLAKHSIGQKIVSIQGNT